MAITRTDRALLIRIGGHLRAAAALEFNGYGNNWGCNAESKEVKRRYDRLCRDEGDLEALRKRLEAEVVPDGAGNAG